MTLTKEEARAQLLEKQKELEAVQKQKAEKEITLADLYKDETSGKYKLPMVNGVGFALLEKLNRKFGDDELGSIEQLMMLVWILKNQSNKKVLRMSIEEISDEIFDLTSTLDLNDLEQITEAVEEVFAFLSGEPEGNAPSPTKKAKTKASKSSK